MCCFRLDSCFKIFMLVVDEIGWFVVDWELMEELILIWWFNLFILVFK